MSRFAILIPTLFERRPLMARLLKELRKQIALSGANVNILIKEDNGELTTGAKRNALVKEAVTMGIDYHAFFDDDDLPGPTYIKRQMEVVNSGKDCGSLWGNIYFAGQKGKPFHHSIQYDHWFENKYLYARSVNHLNCVKTSIAAQFPFPDQVFGEDGVQSLSMVGVLKTEHVIDDVIYHYFTGTKDTEQEKEYIKQLTV